MLTGNLTSHWETSFLLGSSLPTEKLPSHWEAPFPVNSFLPTESFLLSMTRKLPPHMEAYYVSIKIEIDLFSKSLNNEWKILISRIFPGKSENNSGTDPYPEYPLLKGKCPLCQDKHWLLQEDTVQDAYIFSLADLDHFMCFLKGEDMHYLSLGWIPT